MNDRTELANRLREHANQSKSLATWIRELGANDSARTAKHHEAKAADLTAAADLIERETAVPESVRMPEPMTDEEIHKAIEYCYGLIAACSAVEAEVLRRVREANK